MGASKEMKNPRLYASPKKDSGLNSYPNMYTFHPTTEEKSLLSGSPVDCEKDLSRLAAFISRGCTLSIGMRLDTGSFYATMREKSDDWKRARAVSAWHGDPCKALKALAFVLTNKLEDFPEVAIKPTWKEDDW